jgi:hypothetical protein
MVTRIIFSDESPSGDSSGNVYGVIPCIVINHATCIQHEKINNRLPILRFKEKVQRLVFRTLTFNAHLTVWRKTPAPPVASNNTKPASCTYGLSGLNDWCDRQFAAEGSV